MTVELFSLPEKHAAAHIKQVLSKVQHIWNSVNILKIVFLFVRKIAKIYYEEVWIRPKVMQLEDLIYLFN